jgi:hypothetical protein
MSNKTTNGKPSIFFSPTVKSPLGSALFAKLDEPDVFRGGDPHPFLSDIDPATGLTANEQFRAGNFTTKFTKNL